ncbi:MAG: branched-chain amino acid ABC transporter substrate-binding protein [Chloroflexota bacterium]
MRRNDITMAKRFAAVMGAALIVVLAAACNAGGGGKIIRIGIELPQSGNEVANGGPTKNGVLLAIKQANAANKVAGFTFADNNQDDAVNGVHDPTKGADNMRILVADTTVLGVVGPFNSGVARAEIPVSNESGLAQCSPANTGTDLTQAGSDVYRFNKQAKRNYFRVAAPDNIQGPAGADYTYTDLGKHSVFIMDDTEPFGVGVADAFEARFKELGGTVVGTRASVPKSTTDYTPFFTAAAALNPEAVYFGGTQVTGGGLARKQMVAAGMGAIPFVGPDGIADLGAGGNTGAFITLAGVENSNDVHGTVAGLHDLPASSTFNTDYQAEYNTAPGAYSALGYSCAQAIIQAVAATATAANGDFTKWRGLVRDYIFDTAAHHTYDTVMGTISFNACGDIEQPVMSFYKVDQTANDGKGGWVYIKQQAFQPGGC